MECPRPAIGCVCNSVQHDLWSTLLIVVVNATTLSQMGPMERVTPFAIAA